jgi:hypothetical protein
MNAVLIPRAANIIRDSSDEFQTRMNIRVFLAVLQDRREVLTATRSPPAVVSEMRIKPSYRGGDQACRGPQYGRLRGSRWQRHCFVSELTS